MPVPGLPAVSGRCAAEDHDGCDHVVATGARLLSRQRESRDVICDCSCHSRCPLAGRDQVVEAEWSALCVCAGAERRRERLAQAEVFWTGQSEAIKAAMAEVDVGHGRSASEIQAEMESALRRHGVELSPRVNAIIAEFASASTGSRLTAAPKLLRMTGRLAAQGVRFLREHRE
jgi:hypothetical protein